METIAGSTSGCAMRSLHLLTPKLSETLCEPVGKLAVRPSSCPSTQCISALLAHQRNALPADARCACVEEMVATDTCPGVSCGTVKSCSSCVTSGCALLFSTSASESFIALCSRPCCSIGGITRTGGRLEEFQARAARMLGKEHTPSRRTGCRGEFIYNL